MSFEKMSKDNILIIANPIMDNLMDASTHIDHQRHVKDFTHRMKNIVTEAYLEKACHDYQEKKGFFTDRRYAFLFKRPESVTIIWKQSFTKAKGEFAAQMVLVHEDDKFLVDHVTVS